MIEVEHKYRVADHAEIEHQLVALGGSIRAPELQVDTYFAHPARDFAVTDEALRIRCVGDANYITYKGPKLDARTKTRREIELPLTSEAAGASDFAVLLTALDFRVVREVCKQRRSATIDWQNQQVEIALDHVAGLGNFVELELLVEESTVPAAQTALAALAQRLQLTDDERRSYLELLLITDR